MPRFTYRAMTARGDLISGEIIAPDRSEVQRRLEYLGHILVDMRAEGEGGLLKSLAGAHVNWRDAFARKPRADDVTMFSRDFAALLKSGLRIDQALDLLSDAEMTGVMAKTVGDLRGSISSGESLADGMAHFPDLFPPVFVSMVRVGEASGNLAAIMDSLSEERARIAAMRRNAIDALKYPAFVLTAAVAVLTFFLIFVLPQFATVLNDLGSRMDPIVAAMLAASAFVRANGDVILAVLALIALGGLIASRSPAARGHIWAAVQSLPGVSVIVRDYRTAVFCRGLGALLQNGMMLSPALSLAAGATFAGEEAQAWKRVGERIRQGAKLAEALNENRTLADTAVRMLRIGEEAGSLGEIATRTADLFEQRVERRLRRLVGMIGPAAIIFIAAVVGFVVVSLMTSLISIGQLAS